MQLRRHRMRQQQRRDSAQERLRTDATVSVKSYAKRYGVDRYTAYEDLTAPGFELPDSAQQWAQRPPATPRRTAERSSDQADDESWIMLDGRLFFEAGYTSGGAPFGMFANEMPPYDDPSRPRGTTSSGMPTIRSRPTTASSSTG